MPTSDKAFSIMQLTPLDRILPLLPYGLNALVTRNRWKLLAVLRHLKEAGYFDWKDFLRLIMFGGRRRGLTIYVPTFSQEEDGLSFSAEDRQDLMKEVESKYEEWKAKNPTKAGSKAPPPERATGTGLGTVPKPEASQVPPEHPTSTPTTDVKALAFSLKELAACLEPDVMHPLAIKAILLKFIKPRGLNLRQVYEMAVEARPKEWNEKHPAPKWEQLGISNDTAARHT